MYIIAIGWLWVAFMMAITETSITAALLTFLLYGLFPCGIVMYLLGTPVRRRRLAREKARAEAETRGERDAQP
jgi:biotin transporter BioY